LRLGSPFKPLASCRWAYIAALAGAALSTLAVTGCSSSPGGHEVAGTQQCSTVTAVAPRLDLPRPIQVLTSLPSQPYAVVATAHWAFVSYPTGSSPVSGLISVVAMQGSVARLARTVSVPGQPMGLALAGAGRFLLVANFIGGLEVLSTAALESGHGQPVIARLPSHGNGPDEVAVTGDGRYAFVPEEDSADVAVFGLGGLLSGRRPARGQAGAGETGLIRVADSPAGIALSPDGSRLYVASEGNGNGPGRLAVISVPQAERDPAHAVIESADAGCSPVRVALSPGGTLAWVTDRGGNTILAFRLNSGHGSPIGHLAAAVRVGSEPVEVTFLDSGALAMVTDSSRFNHPNSPQTIAVISTARALAHQPALLGYLPAGAFPRQFGQAPGGPLLFTDFDSEDVRVISTTDLTWLTTRIPRE
jgi:DNA-binding beta-propeller fold protein YncE